MMTPRRLFATAYKSPYVRSAAKKYGRTIAKRAYAKASTYARRRYKKRRVTKSARSTFGESRSRTIKQVCSTRATVDDNLASRSLYLQPLINIFESDDNRITTRMGNLVYLKGIRLCFERKNTQGFPLYYNYAVVSLKHSLDITRSDINGDTEAVANFFRAEGVEERAIPFTSSLDSIQYHCRPINTDIFRVHTHKRFLIPGAGAATADNTNWEADPYGDKAFKNYRFDKRYIKLNRTIRWANDGQTDGGTDILLNQIWLVQWCCVFGDVTGTVSADQMNSKVEIATLFNQEKI